MLAVHLSGNISLGELIVGAGTLGLAGVTWWLARVTRASVTAAEMSAEAAQAGAEATEKSAKAAEEGVETARESAKAAQAGVAAAKESADAARESANAERDSVEAMAMPYVIAVPTGEEPGEIYRVRSADDAGGTLRLCLWNLGSGPGIVTNICLVCHEKELLVALPRGIPLGAGNQFNAWVDAADWPTSATAGSLRIEYLHSNGRLYRTDSDVRIEEGQLTCLTFRRSPAQEQGGG